MTVREEGRMALPGSYCTVSSCNKGLGSCHLYAERKGILCLWRQTCVCACMHMCACD